MTIGQMINMFPEDQRKRMIDTITNHLFHLVVSEDSRKSDALDDLAENVAQDCSQETWKNIENIGYEAIYYEILSEIDKYDDCNLFNDLFSKQLEDFYIMEYEDPIEEEIGKTFRKMIEDEVKKRWKTSYL